MKSLSLQFLAGLCGLVIMMQVAVSNAEEASSPAKTPSAGDADTNEPVLPTPEGESQNPESGLLPEEGALPAKPPPETPRMRDHSTTELSGNASETDARFEKIQSLAMDSPRALYLLKRAHSTSHSSVRRVYLREYYATLAAQMRKLDPGLKSSIDAYEESKIREISGTDTPAARTTSHRTRSRHLASRESRHRSHRLSSGYRYRRMIIIEDPYGPPYYPYPFGPPQPMYGPW
ncbi:MAG TPA: hypothetical protein VE860_27085 [Chthoniobacterales bacterium]|nr:hypothetical protein [Chthoniobacterales bacterium]